MDFSYFKGVHWQESGELLLLENIGKVKFAPYGALHSYQSYI